MSKWLKHFITICKHKYYVFLECCKLGIPLQGLIHDTHKLYPNQFISSAKYWTGVGSPVEAERKTIGYSLSWRYHKGHPLGKHHWQYWTDIDGWDSEGRPKINPAPMPTKYIKEMVADMFGAARAYGAKDYKQSAREYYQAKSREWVLHPTTWRIFHKLMSRDCNDCSYDGIPDACPDHSYCFDLMTKPHFHLKAGLKYEGYNQDEF